MSVAVRTMPWAGSTYATHPAASMPAAHRSRFVNLSVAAPILAPHDRLHGRVRFQCRAYYAESLASNHSGHPLMTLPGSACPFSKVCSYPRQNERPHEVLLTNPSISNNDIYVSRQSSPTWNSTIVKQERDGG
jgi:hypothetical protein